MAIGVSNDNLRDAELANETSPQGVFEDHSARFLI